jgi:tetratricopeptide (TPR) repeat protein
MVRVMAAEIERSPRQSWCWLGYWLAVIVSLTLLVGLLFPWGTSAYYVERAGRKLETDEPTDVVYQTVERQLRQALLWHPQNAQAYRLLAQLYEQQADWMAVAEAWTEYVALRPTDPQGFWELAMACERLGISELPLVSGQPCGVDEASRQAALSQLWAWAGQTAGSFVQAGAAMRQGEDWSQAIAYYQRALVLEPEAAAAWYGLGEVYRACNETESAWEAYTRVIDLNSDSSFSALAYDRRGEILAEAGQWAEASAELAQAVALAPEDGHYHLNYGWYLYRAGAPLQEARAELERAAILLPADPWPHFRLADLDFVAGDYEGMLARARQSIETSPKHSWGWMLQSQALRHLQRPTEAEISVRHAIELVPNSGGAYTELGHVLKQQNRLDEAIEAYKQALVLRPDNAGYHLNLGSAYRASGQVDLAQKEYQLALELDPDNSVARQALEELER